MKKALVTGGTKGIGRGIVTMLLQKGYYVYITYSSDVNAAQSCEEHFSTISRHFSLHQIDNSDYRQIQQLTEQIKHDGLMDCIVFNAGYTLRKSLSDIENDDWEKAMNVNLNSNVYIIRNLLNHIAPNSRLVFIGSMMGIYPHAVSLAYGVTKAAVHALTQNLMKVFEGTGTTVNAIAPGFIETEWQKNKPEYIRNKICEKTALHRFGNIDEVVSTVELCLNNQFINGSIIEVNGGYCYR